MRLLRLIFVGGFGLLPMAALPSAMQLTLPVETATSRLNVELCVLAECDMQTSQLQGSVTVGLDLDSVPPQISLRDFNLQASSNYNFHLDYGLLGDIFAQARGLRVYHAAPGPAQPFVVVTNQQFTFVNVPFLLSGTANYNASGVICSLIQGNGQPCTGSLDLAAQPAALISELSGRLDTNNNLLSLSIQFTFLSPLDSTNPDLGTIAGSAVVNFSAVTVPPTAPALRIAPADPGYVLSWPSTAVGFRLWATTSLRAPITWTPINEPVRDDGTWRTVNVPDQGEASFFRLAAE
jgi:hypothetical protein